MGVTLLCLLVLYAASFLPVIVAFPYAFPDCVNGPLSSFPICDTTRSGRVRAVDLISRWTIEEKIANTVHTSPGVPRLDVPPFNWWSDADHGLAYAPV